MTARGDPTRANLKDLAPSARAIQASGESQNVGRGIVRVLAMGNSRFRRSNDILISEGVIPMGTRAMRSAKEILRPTPGPKRTDPQASPTDNAAENRGPALDRLLAEKFPAAGREERIAGTLKALKKFRVDFKLDRDTWKWIAEDPDLEDI